MDCQSISFDLSFKDYQYEQFLLSWLSTAYFLINLEQPCFTLDNVCLVIPRQLALVTGGIALFR